MASTEVAACQACKKTFTLNNAQQDIVTELKGKGLSFIMIECPSCGTSTPYIPETLHEPTQHKQNDVYRCLVSHCSGWVSWVNRSSSFLGAESVEVFGMTKRIYMMPLDSLSPIIPIEHPVIQKVMMPGCSRLSNANQTTTKNL